MACAPLLRQISMYLSMQRYDSLEGAGPMLYASSACVVTTGSATAARQKERGRFVERTHKLDVHRVAVSVAVDGDRLDAELARRPEDTARDLAAARGKERKSRVSGRARSKCEGVPRL